MVKQNATRTTEQLEEEWADWSPPPLFKYVSLQRASQILRRGEIRLTQPCHLNDPHELSVEINPQSMLRDLFERMVSEGVDLKKRPKCLGGTSWVW